VFDVDSIGLTRMAHNLNHGWDVGGQSVDPPTGIFIGVGANPCAVDLEREIDRYFRKLDAGAEFAITQPVFDADALLGFLDRVEGYRRRIPVIAGVWPLLSFKNAEFMSKRSAGRGGPKRDPGTDGEMPDEGGGQGGGHCHRPRDDRKDPGPRQRVSGQRPAGDGRDRAGGVGEAGRLLVVRG
jgi:hypothetical protein